MDQQQFDVVIVGGAAIGSSAAYFLSANPGFSGRIAVVEPDPSYQFSATALSAASIRHQFSNAENIRMSLFGTQFLRDFATLMAVDGSAPDPAFHEGGYLFLATEQGLPTLRQNQALQTQLGADIALLSTRQLQDRFPWLVVDDLAAGALGVSGEGWLDAYAMMQGLRRKAVAQGVQYIKAKVVGLQASAGRVGAVTLDDGRQLACGAVVNAAGTGARALVVPLGIDLPVRARKRSVFYVQCPDPLPGCPMVIDPSGAYFRPEGQGFIMGVAPPADQDPDATDFEVQHTLFEDVLWPTLAARVPAFEALRCQRSWAGHYDMNLFDQNLIIGLHPAWANLYFANGLSGHGMQQAPAIGRALSELITTGRYQTLDLGRLGWQRILDDQPLVEINVV
ncbi:NAD(P)/FAD-dependent oxidoreductase [Castellaniella sp.]|uniref:NAD(P)/FAD-dependent oxidoreductase n=1 Tax=Castellaniella sp. TaxID=1955812 RepID=UPI0035643C6D